MDNLIVGAIPKWYYLKLEYPQSCSFLQKRLSVSKFQLFGLMGPVCFAFMNERINSFLAIIQFKIIHHRATALTACIREKTKFGPN